MVSISIFLDLCSDVLIVGLIGVLGSLIVLSLIRGADPWAILSLAIPMGSAALTLPMFLLSWAGIPVSLPTWVILYLGLLLVIRQKVGQLPPLPIFERVFWRNIRSKISIRHGYWIPVAVMIGATIVLATGRSYSTWDAAGIWSAKGYGIALEKTIFAGQIWGAHGLSYPLHIPMLISLFQSVGGDLLPGSKLIFPLFFTSVLFGAYRYWRQNRSGQLRAILGILMLGSIPLIFEHATIGYANLAFSSYLVLASLMGIESIHQKSRGLGLLSSILFGFATWTRPEGILLSSISLVTIGLARTWLYRRPQPLRIWLLPFLIIAVPWLIFLLLHGTQGQIPHQVLSSLGEITHGNLNLTGLRDVFKYFIDQTINLRVWGVLYPLAAIIAFFSLGNFRGDSNRSAVTLLLVFLAISASVIIMYYLTSFSELGLDWWLPSGFNRMLMPASLLLGVLCIQLSNSDDQFETIP